MAAKARIIRVRVDRGKAGLFYAESPDLPGLLVASKTLEEMNEKICTAISDLFRAQGIEVVVAEAEDGGDQEHPWVAVPREIVAAQAMGALGSDD